MAQQPDLPQVACFDTAFHAAMPATAQSLGLPPAFEAKGLRRYGFHGLSYEYVTGRLAELCGGRLPKRLVIAHLGNGASMAAVLDGKGHATTMGFSTLDGLVMGTRIGGLDPGAILHLMREEKMDLKALEDLFYNRSGLLGLSGISADMKTLIESRDPRAAAAIEQYCYAITRHAGSLAAALGGLDALAFTGGVGENAAPIRARVCRDLAWLGLALDEAANDKGGPRLTKASSKLAAYAVPTDEEFVIARHTAGLLGL
jgi:acetate kinase